MIKVEIDWGRDGFGTLDDVTADVRSAASVELRYGRDTGPSGSVLTSGSGAVTLGNRSRKYTARNTSSPLYGKIKPGRPVRITRTHKGTTYSLFRGHTDENPLNPDISAKTMTAALVDYLSDFRGGDLSTPVYAGLRTGAAINVVLDSMGWPSDLRDIDPGSTQIPYWWGSGDAMSALESLIRSEGMAALLTVGGDGEVVFRDRHHRLTRARSVTAQQTWRDLGTMAMSGFELDEAWPNVVNSGSASVPVRRPADVEVVWSSESVIALAAGEVKVVTASTSDPVLNAVVPVVGVDMTVTGTVTTRLITTSGVSIGIELKAIGAPAVVSGLQLRASTLAVSHTVEVSVEDSDSIDEYGRRSYQGELPWCGPYDAEAILATFVAAYARPRAVAKVRFVCHEMSSVTAQVLACDISDRIRIIEPETGVDEDFYIESVQHNFSGTHDHEVTFDLEAAPQDVSPLFRLDVAGAGADQGKLSAGLDDPDSLLLLDSSVAGHRLDEGVTST